MLSQTEVIKLLQGEKGDKLKVYKKFGDVKYNVNHSDEPEIVTTVIKGLVETTNTAHPGDLIITGPSGERFVVRPEKAGERYTINPNKFGYLIPVGKVYAIEWENDGFMFMAPWNALMVCEKGDMLCSPDPELSEVYRIEKEMFTKTYKLI